MKSILNEKFLKHNFWKIFFYLHIKKIMSLKEIVESMTGQFMSSILHLLSLIYRTFPCLDPYSEYGSGSTKVLNTDPIWILIHNIGITYRVLQV